jgi:hypothetical protein
MKETPSQKNLFTGSLDLDNEARSVKDNDYVDALNIRNSVSRDGKDKQVTKIRGNELVPFVQPQTPIPSSNKCIGAFENLATRLNYSFIYNSQGAMQIRENNIDSGTVTSVVEYNFGWQDDKFISNVDLVDNKLLLWTDTKPRRINISKSREDKNFKGNIYLTNTEVANATYTIAILDKFNNVVAIAGATFASPLNRRLAADFLTAFINNNSDLNPLCTAKTCQEHIEIEFTNQGYFIIDIQANNNVGTIYVPQNYYFSITETIIDAGKYPLNCPPRLQIKQDDKRAGFNNIERTTWQFATQVIYDDFDESTLSPYSDIAFINCEQRGNYIEVDFTDTRLNDPVDLSIISKIRILARPSNQGKFREIAVIEQQDLWLNSGQIGSNTIRFYNDGQYTIIDDATATLPYSALPIEIVGDKYDMGEENFDNRVGYSKFIENYEAPCITAELTPTFTPNEDFTCTISGQVLIINTEQFQASPSTINAVGWHKGSLAGNAFFNTGNIGVIHQTENDLYPVFGGARNTNVLTDISNTSEQILPEGGFPIYLAGTDYLAISKQQQTLSNVTYQGNGIINTSTGQLQSQLRQWYTDYNTNPGGRGVPFSSWKMQGVKAGTYILRAASHLCSFGDKLSKGSRYDLFNRQAYQTTSTYLKGINVWNPQINDFFNFEDSYEVFLEINPNGTYSVFRNNLVLILNEPIVNGELFLGQMWVEDLSLLRRDIDGGGVKFYTGTAFSGYLVDANGNVSAEDMKTAISMERQAVTLVADIVLDPLNPFVIQDRFERNITTDHNGFIYGSYYQRPLDAAIFYGFRSESVTGGGISQLASRIDTSEYYFSDTSIFSAIQNETANYGRVVNSNLPTPLTEVKHQYLFLPNTNQQVTRQARTTIRGRVINSNGAPVSGVLVQYSRTGRNERTQQDGTFSLLVYGATDEVNLRTDILIYNSCCECIYDFISRNLPYEWTSIQINPFGRLGSTLGFNNEFPFNLADVVANLISLLSRKLKAGGRYNFALFHVDELNRRHALVTNNLSVSIPFLTEQRQDYFQNVGTGNSNGVFEFDLNVISPPPTWADKLYVARTQDTYYSDYLQFPLYDAKYVVQYDDENSLPIETTFSTFSANEIYLGFPQSTIAYKEFNSASQKGWDFQEGDRVRFISKPNGELYDKLYDLPIKAQRTDSTNEFIYFAVDNLDALGEVTQGTLVEVYRPKKDLDDNVELFFEIHQCIDIVEVNGQKQYVGLPKRLNTGDTYSRNRTVPISNGISSNFIEDNSISDNWQSRQQDIGRVVVKDTRFGRLVRENAIKFSNQYIPGSKLNGLSRFEPLNEFEYPRQYGAINKLIMVNDNADIQVLFVACENNSFVIYIKEVIYNDVRGAETVSVADRVLGSFRTLKGDFGTKNPESFAVRDGQLFWWDINRGAFVRYDNNGMDDVSSLNTLQYALTIGNDTSVISTYDDFYSEFVTVPLQDDKQAIGFLSDKRGWNGFYSFKPEMLGTSGELMLSWKDGNLWIHDSPNVPYCNFYGQQFTSKITFVSKLSPLGLKVAQNLRVKASDVWEALSITTVPNAMYKQGMMSRLKKGNWKNFEGDFWATILRNMNDPRFTDPNVALLRGEPLRGDAFIVELQNDSEDLQSLRMAEMYYFSSENTNG